MGKLVKLILNGKISGKIAKEVFEEMFNSKVGPDEIIESKGLIQVNNQDEINIIIDEVLANNANKVSDYKNGKTKLLGFFVGEAMKKSKGKANPKKLNETLIKKLETI